MKTITLRVDDLTHALLMGVAHELDTSMQKLLERYVKNGLWDQKLDSSDNVMRACFMNSNTTRTVMQPIRGFAGKRIRCDHERRLHVAGFSFNNTNVAAHIIRVANS